jgi:phosphatidylglycerophosphate synthase
MSEEKKSTIQKVPNILSGTRLGMGLLMPFLFIFFNKWGKIIYYACGSATDAADGFIAKNFNGKSDLGKVLDPIADKFFQLMALFSFALFSNRFLLGLVAGEIAIAATNIKRGMDKVETKGLKINVRKSIDTKGMKFWEKVKAYAKGYVNKASVYVDAVKELNVSRFGRVKAVFVAGSVISAVLAPFIPILSTIATPLIITTTVMEAPVVTKYALEYGKELNRLGPKATKVLSKLDSLDRGTDKFTETICIPFKKIKNVFIKPRTNATTVQEQSEGETIMDEDTIDNKEQGEENLTKDEKESTSVVAQDLNFYKYLKYILENGQNLAYDEYAQSQQNLQYEQELENNNLVYIKHQ